MKTETVCVMPILGCLWAALKFLRQENIHGRLIAVNDDQKNFIERFGVAINDADAIPELQCRADRKVEVINAWLKSQGYDIQLQKPADPQAFAVASILNLLVEWLQEGKRRVLQSKNTGDQLYAGVFLKEGVSVLSHPDHAHPIIVIKTKSGDVVKMTKVQALIGHEFAIHDLTQKLFFAMQDKSSYDYEGVVFPMIDLDVQPDISWLCGMKAGGGYFISEALQQTRFRMNQFGAKVESAAAMCLSRGISISPAPYVMDEPFLLWIEGPGMKVPYFSAILAEDVWKEPKSL